MSASKSKEDLTKVKSVPSEFNRKHNYEKLLEKFKEEFLKRWNLSYVSPETGLEGFTEFSVLGSGSFGHVKLIKDKETGNPYAVKMMLKEKIVKLKQVAHVFNEKKVLFSIKFPNAISLELSRKDNDYIYLILPFINGGELFTYHRKMRKFSEKQARFYGAQVLLALEYLHYLKLLYRDLKPENIMIDARGYLKLTDFGFAKYVETRTMTLCGTPEYLAPEIIQSKPYGTSADWWSFGVFIYEMVAGNSPFSQHNRDVMLMYAKICDGVYKMPPAFSIPLRDMIENLLQVDLSRRYGNLLHGVKDIKYHEWFKSVDWMGLLNQELTAPYVPYVKNVDDASNFDKYPETKRVADSKMCKHAEVFKDF